MRVGEMLSEAGAQVLAETAPEDEVLTPEQLAEWLKVEPSWVAKYTQAKLLPGAFKVGKPWRYLKVEVLRQILTRRQVLLESQAEKHARQEKWRKALLTPTRARAVGAH